MQYKKQIDGLRAIAVLSVLFFHADYSLFKGGYIGVDIFFVISGYLITSIILKDLSNNSFTIRDFYGRRIRRIVPVLFFVVFIVTFFSFLWLLPYDLRYFGKSLASIPFFSSNFIFYLEGGYFDQVDIRPLGHTWSLGIEEQFYLLYPIFLLTIYKTNKKFLVFLIILMSSFLVSYWWSIHYPRAAYFLLPSRIWELFAGGLIAVYGNKSFLNNKFNIEGFSQTMSFLGLLLIIYSIYHFDEKTIFPGLNAIIPVAGTSLIILYASNNTLVSKILSNKILVFGGLISYSIYLWHQPIFVFFKVFFDRNPDQLEKIFLIWLTVFLSYLTWKYIEKPFRNNNVIKRKIVVLVTLIPSVLFLTVGFHIYSTSGLSKLYNSNAMIDLYNTKTITDTECHANDSKSAKEISSGKACKFGNKNLPPEFAIIGDSHASSLFNYLNEIFSKNKSFIGISNGNCPALLNEFRYEASIKECEEINRASFQFIAKQKSIKKIILYSEWSNYTEGYRIDSKNKKIKYYLAQDKFNKATKVGDNEAILKRSLLETINFLKRSNKEIIIIKSTPEFEENVMKAIARNILYKKNYNFEDYPKITFAQYKKRNKKIQKIFSNISGVKFIESYNLLCDKNICPSLDENKNVLYSDTNHLTYHGSKKIVKNLVNLITSNKKVK